MDVAEGLTRIGTLIGLGLIAGLAGIAAMTLSQVVEMKLTRRDPSSSPGDAACKVIGIEIATQKDRLRFSNLVHWLYGSAWGIVRGILWLAGLRGWPATALHFGLVWGVALLILPGLKVAPPVREWGIKWLVIDAFHHLVYAVVVGLVYDWLAPF